MKAVKILAVVIIIIALPFIIALFMPKLIIIEHETIVNKPLNVTYNYVRYLKNKEQYSHTALIDPSMKKTYTGVDGKVGFIATWDSDNKDVGKSEQKIIKLIPNQRVDIEIRFKEPAQSTDTTFIGTSKVTEDTTAVKLGYLLKMNYPTNLMMPFYRNKIEKDMIISLANLKKILNSGV